MEDARLQWFLHASLVEILGQARSDILEHYSQILGFLRLLQGLTSYDMESNNVVNEVFSTISLQQNDLAHSVAELEQLQVLLNEFNSAPVESTMKGNLRHNMLEAAFKRPIEIVLQDIKTKALSIASKTNVAVSLLATVVSFQDEDVESILKLSMKKTAAFGNEISCILDTVIARIASDLKN